MRALVFVGGLLLIFTRSAGAQVASPMAAERVPVTALAVGMTEEQFRALPELTWKGPTINAFDHELSTLTAENPSKVQGSPDNLQIAMRSGKVVRIDLHWSGDVGASEQVCLEGFRSTLHWAQAIYGSFSPARKPARLVLPAIGLLDQVISTRNEGVDAYSVSKIVRETEEHHRVQTVTWSAHHLTDAVEVLGIWELRGSRSECAGTWLSEQ